LITESRSGLSVTAPMGVQFLVLRDHRAGLASRALMYPGSGQIGENECWRGLRKTFRFRLSLHIGDTVQGAACGVRRDRATRISKAASELLTSLLLSPKSCGTFAGLAPLKHSKTLEFVLSFGAIASTKSYEPRGRGFESCQPHQNQGLGSQDPSPLCFRGTGVGRFIHTCRSRGIPRGRNLPETTRSTVRVSWRLSTKFASFSSRPRSPLA
jgi:hypothetical protein